MSIVHSTLIDKFSWEPLYVSGSDHTPILITYDNGFEIPEVNSTTRFKWRLTKGDWSKFKEQVEKDIPTEYNNWTVKRLERRLTDTIICAAKKYIKKKKINAKSMIDLVVKVMYVCMYVCMYVFLYFDSVDEFTFSSQA